jgi:hypothetical protein
MDERQPPQPIEERREPKPLQKDAETEGGGVAQGDIRVPRHPKQEEEEKEGERR